MDTVNATVRREAVTRWGRDIRDPSKEGCHVTSRTAPVTPVTMSRHVTPCHAMSRRLNLNCNEEDPK
jgi:hypothetical protein